MLTKKVLLSSGSDILPLVTSLPVRMIESSVRFSAAQPVFSIVKVLSQSQPCAGFFGFLFASAGPKLRAVAPPSSVTLTDGGALTVIVKEQAPLIASASRAKQVTVVTPTGNTEPDGGEHATVALKRESVSVGRGYCAVAEH